jgi:hypothetical protein
LCSTFFSTLDIIASSAILKDIHIPDDVLPQLERALRLDSGRAKEHRKSEGERLQNRLAQVRHRVEEVYLDKLHGKISEAFWEAKTSEWNQDEHQIRNHWHKNLRTVRNRDWRARNRYPNVVACR